MNARLRSSSRLVFVVAPATLLACSSASTPSSAPPPSAAAIVTAGEAPPIDPPAGPNDVVGSIYDTAGNRRVGATVLFDGKRIPTDAWGRFVVRDAPATYDVTIAKSDGAVGTFGSMGATSRTPKITVDWTQVFGSLHTAYPAPSRPDAKVMTFVSAPNGMSTTSGLADDIWMRTRASTVAPTPATVFAFEFLEPNTDNPPTQFLRWAKESIVLQPGPNTWTPTFVPVTETRTLTPHPTTDSGMTVYEGYYFARATGSGDDLTMLLPWMQLNAPASWAFPIPVVDGIDWSMRYHAFETGKPGSYGGGASYATEPIAADITAPDAFLPEAPVVTSPPADATFGSGTTIAWQGGREVCDVMLTPPSPFLSTDPKPIVLRTTARSVVVPDLAALGVEPPSGLTYTLIVQCSDPARTAPHGIVVPGNHDSDSTFAPLDDDAVNTSYALYFVKSR
ncbi:MAG TPA: hypothetical protein VF407_10075 [Polyangiaceae bacterium]